MDGGNAPGEDERVRELLNYNILDTPGEEEFDDITKVAAYLCDTDRAMINFLTHDRQWSKSCHGWELQEIPRNKSICTYAIQRDKYLIINNVSEDPRFKNLGYVKEKNVEFYAGVVLKSNGYSIGTLCIFDDKPRELTDNQLEALQVLGRDVESKLELRLKREQLIKEHRELKETTTFLRNSADLMMILDPGTLKILEVNDEVEELTGYKPDEILNSKLTDFIQGEDFGRKLAAWRSMKAGPRFSQETLFKTKGEALLWLRISMTEEGDKYFATGRNITERKGIEQNLVDQKQFTENIIRHLPGIFFLVDEGGTLRRWNNNLENIEQRSREEVVGQPYNEFIKNEDHRATTQAMQKVFREGYARTEINYIAPDGQEIPLLLSGFRYQEDGDTFIIGIGINITEEKRALEELERKEQKLEEAQRIAKMGSWSWHIPTNELVWSDEVFDLLGLDKEKVQPTIENFKEMLPESGARKVEKIIGEIFEGREGRAVEFEVERPDGAIVYIQERFEVHRDSEGIPLEISGTMQDVTDRRKAEEQTRSALREKEVLLAEVHHRVKNNLAVINSLLQLEIFNTDNEELANILTQSQMRIRSMALIHETLYSYGDFANISFEKYLRELTRAIVETVTVEPQKIDFELESEEVDLTINQSVPCGLIINELIINAVKYAFPGSRGGTISVSLKERGERVHLTVADNGKGLDPDVDIYNPDSLGLTLVNTLVHQLQGDLEVEVEDGTAFNISFKKKVTKGSGASAFFSGDQ